MYIFLSKQFYEIQQCYMFHCIRSSSSMDVHNLRELENFILTVTLDYFTFYLVCLLNHVALLLKMKENTPEITF